MSRHVLSDRQQLPSLRAAGPVPPRLQARSDRALPNASSENDGRPGPALRPLRCPPHTSSHSVSRPFRPSRFQVPPYGSSCPTHTSAPPFQLTSPLSFPPVSPPGIDPPPAEAPTPSAPAPGHQATPPPPGLAWARELAAGAGTGPFHHDWQRWNRRGAWATLPHGCTGRGRPALDAARRAGPRSTPRQGWRVRARRVGGGGRGPGAPGEAGPDPDDRLR